MSDINSLDAYVITKEASIKKELIEQGWNPNYMVVTKFQQDTTGSYYFDEELKEEVIVPPTYNWHARINSQRLSNGAFFTVSIVFLNSELEENKQVPETLFKILDEDFNNAIETMKEFSVCNCTADEACDRHKE